MSEKLDRNKDFLKLLISTTKTQAKALLKTLSKAQLDCLVEIAHNLVPLPRFYHRQKRLLKFIANPLVNIRDKQRVITKYSRVLLNIFKEVKSDIFDQL